MGKEKIFINLMVDEEDTKYTYAIATKTNCVKLIEDCVKFFYDARDFYDFKDCMQEYETEYKEMDKRLLEYINKHIEDYCDTYNNALLFAQKVLEDCNELIESVETKIYW